jgi:hypothetical protein
VPKIPNAKKLLVSTVPWVAALGLAAGGVVGTGLVVGHLRQSQDASWCRKVTPTHITVKGASQPIDPQTVHDGLAACVAQRRAQRGIFGAVWRTGGEETAVCAVDWGRYQQLSDTDPSGATAVITPFGIKDQLDAGSRTDQQKFLATCLRTKPTG